MKLNKQILLVFVILIILLFVEKKYALKVNKQEDFEVYETHNLYGNNVQKKYENQTEASYELQYYKDFIQEFIDRMYKEYPNDRNVQILKKRYKPSLVYEVAPNNGETSFIRNKKLIGICIRCGKNENNFNGRNTTKNVILHELTHLALNSWGHKGDFPQLFEIFKQKAIEWNMYKKITNKENYCGIHVY